MIMKVIEYMLCYAISFGLGFLTCAGMVYLIVMRKAVKPRTTMVGRKRK